jgi:hypothetical protein
LFQVKRANRPAHDEHVFSAGKLEPGCPSMEVGMCIESVMRASLNFTYFTLAFHGEPDPLAHMSFHGTAPLHRVKGSPQAGTDRFLSWACTLPEQKLRHMPVAMIRPNPVRAAPIVRLAQACQNCLGVLFGAHVCHSEALRGGGFIVAATGFRQHRLMTPVIRYPHAGQTRSVRGTNRHKYRRFAA